MACALQRVTRMCDLAVSQHEHDDLHHSACVYAPGIGTRIPIQLIRCPLVAFYLFV